MSHPYPGPPPGTPRINVEMQLVLTYLRAALKGLDRADTLDLSRYRLDELAQIRGEALVVHLRAGEFQLKVNAQAEKLWRARGKETQPRVDEGPTESIVVDGHRYTPDELRELLGASGFLLREAIASTKLSKAEDGQTIVIEGTESD